MFSIERFEFDRLQTQLIELRTANYQLKEQHSKTSSELSQLQQTVQSQTRDLERANKSIQRSKKAKEFSSLVEENDLLQRKLERQDEDFRMQNKTLMDELSKVCDEKDGLRMEFDRIRVEVGESGVGGEGVLLADQLTHLRAENIALVKSMQVLQEKLKEHPDDSSDDVDVHLSIPSDRVMELELRLSTEEEEKKLVQEKLLQAQDLARTHTAELQDKITKLTEKVKKKQDSLMQLQEEKERLFHENRTSLDELTRAKDHDIHNLQSRLQQSLQQLEEKDKVSAISDEVQKMLESLKISKEELSLRCTTLVQEKEFLVKETTKFQDILSELGKELQDTKTCVGKAKKTSLDLEAQLEEARLSQEQLADQVVKTSEEKHSLVVKLEKAQKLAEKRKSLLDDLAIKRQVSDTEQQNRVVEMEEKYKEEISKLEERLQSVQSQNWKLTESVEELSSLQQRVGEERKKVENAEELVRKLEGELSEEKRAKEEEIRQLTESFQEERDAQSKELSECKLSLEEKEGELKSLAEKVEDKREGVRIAERKSQALLKDLKRQLQLMQKREERLQDQLSVLGGMQGVEFHNEVSHDSTSNHSRESSVSSTRGLLKLNVSESSMHAQGGTTPLSSPSDYNQASGLVSEETQELLIRVAELQKEKWVLEERVHHLENTGSALAEDVIQKSEIIKNHFMETKADHHHALVAAKRSSMADKLSPMKLMPWTRSSKEDTLEEINRKMQRALEEALMKNIHLQENVDMLSSSLKKAGTETEQS